MNVFLSSFGTIAFMPFSKSCGSLLGSDKIRERSLLTNLY